MRSSASLVSLRVGEGLAWFVRLSRAIKFPVVGAAALLLLAACGSHSNPRQATFDYSSLSTPAKILEHYSTSIRNYPDKADSHLLELAFEEALTIYPGKVATVEFDEKSLKRALERSERSSDFVEISSVRLDADGEFVGLAGQKCKLLFASFIGEPDNGEIDVVFSPVWGASYTGLTSYHVSLGMKNGKWRALDGAFASFHVID